MYSVTPSCEVLPVGDYNLGHLRVQWLTLVGCGEPSTHEVIQLRESLMAFWLFKCRPDRYDLPRRLADPNPVISWTVSRYREEIRADDTVFLWVTGPDRGIRAVMRVDQPPQDIPELDTEKHFWTDGDESVACRVVGTITHRHLDLSTDALRNVPGLGELAVFHGYQQATNFAVSDAEGAILMDLVGHGLPALATPEVPVAVASPGNEPAGPDRPVFEVGRVYNRRADIHGPFGGQQQGGISTPAGFPCVFLFTSPSGAQHGYADGWTDDGVFRYTGEGQAGDMEFVRGNLAIRDHAVNGRDLHLFESQGKGEGYRYLGRFDCAGWEFGRGPDSTGQDRRTIVFHLVPEGAAVEDETEESSAPPGSAGEAPHRLAELRARALAAARPSGERPPRESRRLYHERSAAVREYVLARAKGICESCGSPAPFRRPDGAPYLEPHHTRRVADGGPDHPRWVGAVCPNCHKEVHHGENGQAKNDKLKEQLGLIEEQLES